MLYPFGDKKPIISSNCFISETACIVGNVSIGENSSVWYNSVIRGDKGKISIGKGSNIQDTCVLHSDESGVVVGDSVTVGHGCILHGCRIKNNVLVGMNAIIMNGAEIEEFCIVGAGALVPPGKKVPSNSVIVGVPCKHSRKTTEQDMEYIKISSKNYEELTEKYLLESRGR